MVNYKKIKKYITNEKELLVPYNSVGNNGILKCIVAKEVIINNSKIKKVLLGLNFDEVYIDGVDIILNNRMEDLCLEE